MALEKLREYTVVLGSGKDESKAVLVNEISTEVKTFDPAKKIAGFHEEESETPSVPAKQKSEGVFSHYEREAGEKVVVLTADVVAVREGVLQHKDTRYEGYTIPLFKMVAQVAAETAYCYEAFSVQWLIALTLQSEDGHKFETQFAVQGEYHDPLARETIQKEYNPNINFQIPLVEQGATTASNFYWVTVAGEKLPMTQKLAEQLIVHRVLPLPLFLQFIDQLASESVNQDWQQIELNYPQFLEEKAERA